MKFIVLDIDGVLNSATFDRHRSENEGNIDVTRLELLKKLIEQTNAKIVLSSTWRKHIDDNCHPIDTVGFELYYTFARYDIELYSKTPSIDSFDRAAEVQAWLDAHKKEVDAFVIFDDIAFGWGALEPYLVKTNYRIGRGLEPVHIERAALILNGG